MYFFLENLSFLEICYTSTILPKMLLSLLTKENGISLSGCFFQFYVFASLACSECYLLSVMSYDRYLAICKPLHYGALMNSRFRIQLAVGSWISGFMSPIFTTSMLASQLTFCGSNKIDHFFCDYTPLLVLSCSNTRSTEIAMSFIGSVCTVPPFLLTVTSYICIIATILKIPSTTGRKKAFSTCSAHLLVVTIFYGALMTVYLLPKNDKKTMAGPKQGNQTYVTEFVFLGFGELHDLQSLLFPRFLMIYILTSVGNIVILALVVTEHRLHTPMYFFLGNLSFLEICYTSTILPRMLNEPTSFPHFEMSWLVVMAPSPAVLSPSKVSDCKVELVCHTADANKIGIMDRLAYIDPTLMASMISVAVWNSSITSS
ncbi:olfactory receptor 6F1-like [Alligator mississippiensis]|uniref:olfactory receptor 6F1-like n=1 Tax=Alligator mississippiensis TaxID=8496 RepID=UPI002877C750|nr:olfactory receptor 6F1-like [Alligator mississippiensis]